ncbi:alanine:cation symporter family protein [bacterium]|nr:alanine:cation symporter family protein [bacterium]
MISELLSSVVDIVWGMPLVFLLIGGGFYLIAISKMQILRGFGHAIGLLFKEAKSEGSDAPGQLSHFRALTNALSATVGMGNIGGVAVAITQGGPGAIFWMWITALVGMNTKFFECTLSMMFRGKDYQGEVQGGPMYVIENALPKYWKPLAVMFAVCGMVGTLSIFNANQITNLIVETVRPAFGAAEGDLAFGFKASLVTGLVLAGMVFYILLGGLQRLANVTSKLVPSMCVIYVLACLIILIQNLPAIPAVFASIFKEAFGIEAIGGGITGAAVRAIMIIGVKRAAFSNEAGMGTAPMAHGNAKTKEPVSEGLVAMLGPFIDTIVICTMTALVILITVPEVVGQEGLSGILVTRQAFEVSFSGVGPYVLVFVGFLFSFSSLVGFANYNQKCWNYLFKGRFSLGNKTFIVFYCSTIVLGAIAELTDVINLLDIGFALMAIPNMLATIVLAPKVHALAKDYFNRVVKVKVS